jgi:D-amino-acid dehydrogenase
MNRDIRHDRVQPLIDWTRALFPGAETNRVVPWAGLRPMMPSMMPRVGRGRRPGVFYNTGHGHLGWTLAAATAQAVSECIATQFADTKAFAARPLRRKSLPSRQMSRFAVLPGVVDNGQCDHKM